MQTQYMFVNGIMIPIGNTKQKSNEHTINLVSKDGIKVDVTVHAEDEDSAKYVLQRIVDLPGMEFKNHENKETRKPEIAVYSILTSAFILGILGFVVLVFTMILDFGDLLGSVQPLDVAKWVVRSGLCIWPMLAFSLYHLDVEDQEKTKSAGKI